ncbi:Na+/H+ antiporter subunit A [Microcella alkaliphila]|uniref:Na(+) H(+) antiporter subunit A n=1 Tax=Microcella alkaliphila TaxID=279828 RepID=A0A0U5BFN0_9MICO|nr:Na+/H+ antiporter subunit A [Microcella alkaliphila]BAU33055.1 Na(+) H(+) antiporter subunit A [Microcella alkaliphila]
MIVVLAVLALASVLVPFLARYMGGRVFFVASAVALGGFIHTLALSPAVLTSVADAPVERLSWIPQLQLTLDLRMDALSWLLTLIVTGIGALVLLYCGTYFRPTDPTVGRFAAVLLAFVGAMYGLVVADDVYLLFVMWEATSVFSYLLIGHYTNRRASRGAALEALITTTVGGLVMLVGLVILAVQAGSSSIPVILTETPSGALTTTAIFLVLVGALSKSAIVPLHFWLPGAMAAPTPVSAYLHAAAMVKAGVFLVLRLAPAFADVPGWRLALVALGVATMVLGGWAALRQTDLKLLLAYGTVSQLGFLVVISGYGTRDTALAAAALLLAHALFKSGLFLIVGIIDVEAGTRDLRALTGLGRRMPVVAGIAALLLASMAGVPPLFGFVAKEAVLHGLLVAAAPADGAGDPVALAALIGVVLGSTLTVAYALRFFWGAFRTKPGVMALADDVRARPSMTVASAVLATASLALGPLAALAHRGLREVAALAPARPRAYEYELALWHGVGLELGLSILTIAGGIGMFLARTRVERLQARLATGVDASDAYWRTMSGVDRIANRVTTLTQRGSLPFYLAVILSVFVLGTGAALVFTDTWPTDVRLWDTPAQVAVGAVMIGAAIAATRAEKRFAALIVVGVTGFGMTAIFAMGGAPDLAITQALVEIVTLIAFVLVLRRLPARLGDRHGSTHKLLRAIIGISVGVVMALVALVASASRTAEPISAAWPALSRVIGHGANVVNVALVDLRAWDTMGELAVVIAAATGVASLLFLRGRTDSLPRVPRAELERTVRDRLARDARGSQRSAWILAGPTLDPRNRSILLEVVVRLTFHAVIVLSLYLLFAGHNLPGGGFAGGLVAGLALVARYLAGGRYELGAAAPFSAGALLGSGILIATGYALAPLFVGAEVMTSTYFEGHLWLLGDVEFVTSTIFDIGVYLVVVGLVLDVLRSLGAEVDRQGRGGQALTVGGDASAPLGASEGAR